MFRRGGQGLGILGAGNFQNIAVGNFITIGPGPYPAAGAIRVTDAFGGGTLTSIIRGNINTDVNFVGCTSSSLFFGDYNAAATMQVLLIGYNVSIQSRAQSFWDSQANTQSVAWREFVNGNVNISLEISAPGGNAKIHFAEGMLPGIVQDQAVTNGNGAVFPFHGQQGKSTGGSGGALDLQGGAPGTGAATDHWGEVQLNSRMNFGGVSVSVAGGGTITLTEAQSQANVIVATGAPGAATTLVVTRPVSTTWSLFFFRNNSTQICNVQFASGTAQAVAAGAGALIYTDGANAQRIL